MTDQKLKFDKTVNRLNAEQAQTLSVFVVIYQTQMSNKFTSNIDHMFYDYDVFVNWYKPKKIEKN